MRKSTLLRKPRDAGELVFHFASGGFDGSGGHSEQLVGSGIVRVDGELGRVLEKGEDCGRQD
jgi:hypothetical protein